MTRTRKTSLALTLVALLAAACSPWRAWVPRDEGLTILGPAEDLDPSALPRDWVLHGADDAGWDRLRLAKLREVPALRIVNDRDRQMVLRRVKGWLDRAPILKWSWNMEPQDDGPHPTSLVVGLNGGEADRRWWEGYRYHLLAQDPPPHDRLIAFVWGDEASHKGGSSHTQPPPPPKERFAPRRAATAIHVQRGGRENAGKWWMEKADVLALYKRFWPEDDIRRVEITFVGFLSEAERLPAGAYFSEVSLEHREAEGKAP